MSSDARKDEAQAAIPHDAPQPMTLWRHYKGGLYVVLATGLDEATLEPVVTYRSLLKGTYWTRKLADWVRAVDGDVPRFTPAKLTDS